MTTLTFNPVFPTVEVTPIDTPQQLKAYVKMLISDSASFIKKDGFLMVHAIKITGDTALIPDIGMRKDADIIIARVGWLFVESSDGKRLFTDDLSVARGNFSSLPVELFKPISGKEFSSFDDANWG
jgi:hypothetical protein